MIWILKFFLYSLYLLVWNIVGKYLSFTLAKRNVVRKICINQKTALVTSCNMHEICILQTFAVVCCCMAKESFGDRISEIWVKGFSDGSFYVKTMVRCLLTGMFLVMLVTGQIRRHAMKEGASATDECSFCSDCSCWKDTLHLLIECQALERHMSVS